MTGLLLLLGGTWARGQTLLNRLVVIEVMEGAATGWEESLTGLFSPTNRTFGLTIDDPCVGLRLESPETVVLGSPAHEQDAALLVPVLQTDTQSRWERLPVSLWTLHYEAYGRPTDLEGTVEIDLHAQLPAHPEGIVRNRLAHPIRQAYLQFRNYRCRIGDLPPGAARRVRAGDWSLRRSGEAQTVAPAYGALPGYPAVDPRASRGYPSDRPIPAAGGEPSMSGPEVADRSLLVDAPILLRPGGREDEAVLIADLPAYRAGARIDGVSDRASHVLLLVRAIVRRSR
jgi:hypothetical protein